MVLVLVLVKPAPVTPGLVRLGTRLARPVAVGIGPVWLGVVVVVSLWVHDSVWAVVRTWKCQFRGLWPEHSLKVVHLRQGYVQVMRVEVLNFRWIVLILKGLEILDFYG